MARQRLVLAAEINVANVQVMQAAGYCLPKKAEAKGFFYPPVECQENSSRLRLAKRLFEKALPFSNEATRYFERWLELQFALDEMNVAANSLGAWHGPVTGSVLRPGNFAFHLLTSRIREKEGNILQAIYEAQTGLELAAASWSKARERAEISRLALLYATYALQVQPPAAASYTYQAGIYAACAGDWPQAYTHMLSLVQKEHLREQLSIEQTAMSELIIDFVTHQRSSFPRISSSTVIDKIRLGPQEANDPFLWLGNRLMEFNPDLCWHGALPIYQWRAAVVPENGQGALLAGRILAEYGDWREAQKYLREAIAREP